MLEFYVGVLCWSCCMLELYVGVVVCWVNGPKFGLVTEPDLP